MLRCVNLFFPISGAKNNFDFTDEDGTPINLVRTKEPLLKFQTEIVKPRVQTFFEGSVCEQTKIILSWIMGINEDEANEYIMNEVQIQNIDFYLEKIKKLNLHLRLLKVDRSLVRNYITGTSWIVLETFMEQHKEDAQHCDQCTLVISVNSNFFVCQKCLLLFHHICNQQHILTFDNNQQHVICSECFF